MEQQDKEQARREEDVPTTEGKTQHQRYNVCMSAMTRWTKEFPASSFHAKERLHVP
jgi:hypothetical protein